MELLIHTVPSHYLSLNTGHKLSQVQIIFCLIGVGFVPFHFLHLGSGIRLDLITSEQIWADLLSALIMRRGVIIAGEMFYFAEDGVGEL